MNLNHQVFRPNFAIILLTCLFVTLTAQGKREAKKDSIFVDSLRIIQGRQDFSVAENTSSASAILGGVSVGSFILTMIDMGQKGFGDIHFTLAIVSALLGLIGFVIGIVAHRKRKKLLTVQDSSRQDAEKLRKIKRRVKFGIIFGLLGFLAATIFSFVVAISCC